MSPILSTVLFAAAAAAEMTTSMWLPAPYSSDEMGFYGSVIGAEGDTVTMAVEYDDSTDMSSLGYDYVNDAETITFHGTTSFENVITTTDAYYEGDMTISYGCSKGSGRGRATCYYSSNGPAVVSSYCEGYSDYSDIVTSTELYTFDDPYTVVTQTETYDYRSYIPDVCASGESTLPESLAVDTLTMNRNSIETYQVVITAGEDKLSATAGSTPSNTAASATATGSSNSTGTIQPGKSGSLTASPSGTAASVPAGTGAAAPMITMAPALAGLGAAVAAFVL